jgi:hypothetical protein
MRVSIFAAAAAVTLGACQPAAEPQPVEAQTAPDASAATPMDAAPVVAPEPTPTPPPHAAAPAPAGAPRASSPRPARPMPAPAPTPPPVDPMAGHDMSKMDGHDMSKMDGMTMPPKQ